MNAGSARIVVAHELAALRRAGFSVLDALSFVAPALPPGELRADAESALAALRSGAESSVRDPVFALAACGDRASAEAFEATAAALEATASARAARSSATLWVTVLLAGPLLLCAALGWWRIDYSRFPVALPAPSAFLYAILDVLKWVGVPLAVLVMIIVPYVLRRAAPGTREFTAAASLLQLAAADEGGVPVTGVDEPLALLTPAERQFLVWRQALTSRAEAARVLARELSIEGRRRMYLFSSVAPVIGFIVIAYTVATTSIAMYLPLFALAGAIK